MKGGLTLDLEPLMGVNDLACFRDWRGERGGGVFVRVLEKRLREERDGLLRSVRVNPEDARQDFRWKMSRIECLESVIAEFKGET